MLSMSNAMSAGQAGGDFSKEDYYLRDAELGQNAVVRRGCPGAEV